MIAPAQSQNLQVKPRWVAPVGVMEGIVAYNCRTHGFPRPVLAMPMWEGAGNQVIDLSMHGNHGTFGGSPTWVAEGIDFDGVSDFVDCGNASSLQSTNGSLSARIKTSDAGLSYRGIVVKRHAHNIFLKDNIFGFYDWGTSAFKTTSINLADGGWHSVVFVYSSGVANETKLYIDGVNKLNATMTVTDQLSSVTCGAGSATPIQLFAGIIDNPYIFDDTLSAAQVKFLYDNPYFMYRIPEELYGYAAAAAGISIPLLMQQMNQFDGGTYALC